MSRIRDIVITDNSGGEVTLTGQDNVPVEVVDSNGLNLDLTPQKNVPIAIKDATGKELLLTEKIRVPVEIEYSEKTAAEIFFYRIDATPVISIDTSIGDTTITVVSSVGVVIGDTITFYEGIAVFQSLVTATTATTITFATSLDYAFTTSALVETGTYNAAVDGSVTPQVFVVKAPPNASVLIQTAIISILDTVAMDDGKFGGLPALTNGVSYRLIDGKTKQLALIINNIGFYQFGFDVAYSDKAPAGQYGYKGRKNFPIIHGVVLNLNGTDNSEIQMIIKDDLTGLTEYTNIVHGHIVE